MSQRTFDEAMRDRMRGGIVGLAVGDALGTTVEFSRPGSFTPVTDMVGGGPFGLKPGAWTDDTSMALCLAESLIETRGFNAVDQLQRYVRWWKQGHLSSTERCFDIGNQTRAALTEHMQTGKGQCGQIGDQNAGNGSLMRLSPVAIAFAANPAEAIELAGESSRTTHGTAACVDACRFFAGMLVGAMTGATKDEILSPMYSPLAEGWSARPLTPKVAAIANGSWKAKSPPRIRGTGYVIDCLEASIWSFANTADFSAAVLKAVNLGYDADTTGAVTGQLAGAFYGLANIPQLWRAMLARSKLILQFADGLIKLTESGDAMDCGPAK